MMKYLDESGLRPGARIAVVGRDPHGAMTVSVDGANIGVGAFAAERLFVSVD